ncbi:polysaccharide synthesis protein GtrA [Actinotalea ferrariae CF5-4]|uniref:Polysaccharide synthesis protein GtrA n=1 Tax=Actinotalea ferrariae CF5-4 TaxID=948458 RepID=A0A021VMX4_9CELL|nr:GtrA family protein [Actinotalea ferrariae]EYR62516.1 polysaccharide synthesis protein GtrA [Actinotalea ferrariae CF5-4]
MRTRALELARFGSVGAVAYVVDVGVFNLLRYGPGGLLEDRPITAKVLSVAVATLVAWLGNRYWTFSTRRTASPRRELVVFGVVNVGGMLVAVACLAFSHYVLGLTSPLADNIAANVVGLVLGTAFRYVAYRRLVFTGTTPTTTRPPDGSAPAAHGHVVPAPHDVPAALADGDHARA